MTQLQSLICCLISQKHHKFYYSSSFIIYSRNIILLFCLWHHYSRTMFQLLNRYQLFNYCVRVTFIFYIFCYSRAWIIFSNEITSIAVAFHLHKNSNLLRSVFVQILSFHRIYDAAADVCPILGKRPNFCYRYQLFPVRNLAPNIFVWVCSFRLCQPFRDFKTIWAATR